MRHSLRLALARTSPVLIVAITLLSTPSLVALSGNPNPTSQTALSTTVATGTLSVLWGDPYAAVKVDEGVGNLTMTVQGSITPRADLPGYYIYSYPAQVDSDIEVQWTASGNTYFFDIYLYQGSSPYNRTTIFPTAGTFAAMYLYYSGTMTVNGAPSTVHGLAALVAAAPGFFSFHGNARATYIVLYPQTYHGNQYVFRWSQTNQIINGLEQPRCDSLTQTVQIT